MPLLEEALEDFPKSEIWRIQTDGWQATKGYNNFREKFYKGMDDGFNFLQKLADDQKITPELIENIYKSAFGHEDGYATDNTLRRGYNTSPGGFEIYLPEPGLEHTAGVSKEGIVELAQMLRKAQETEGPRSKNPIVIDIALGKGFTKTVYLDANSESFENDLLEHFQNASYNKSEYSGEQISPVDCKVSLEWRGVDRKNILAYVQKDIDNYYEELNTAKQNQNPEERKAAELTAVNHLVRKLHQSHYFPDGNGRTFVFLLANLLYASQSEGRC